MAWNKEQRERVARFVVDRRAFLHMTQDEAAQRAGRGLSKPVLSIVENARQESFKPRTLRSLERALSLPTGYIDEVAAGTVGDGSKPEIEQAPASPEALTTSNLIPSDDESVRLRRVVLLLGGAVEHLMQDAVEDGREEYVELLAELRAGLQAAQ